MCERKREIIGGERERSERAKEETESASVCTILYCWSLPLLPLKPTAAAIAFVVLSSSLSQRRHFLLSWLFDSH